MESVTENDLRLKIPCGIIIAGPSNSGKTRLLLRLIENASHLFKPEPKAIVYSYGEYDRIIHKLENEGVIVCQGLPSESLLQSIEKPYLLIMDDLMTSMSEKTLAEIFTKKAHHQNFAAIFVTQNLFEKSVKVARNNSQYIILMRAPNAMLSIRTLGSQLFPRELPFFLDAYKQATSEGYGYLLLDLHPGSPTSLLKVRTKIFPDDKERVIFTSKNA